MLDFKMFLPAESPEDNILVFHAWIADRDSYYIQEVPEFGIHDAYKKLFIDMIDGTMFTKEIDILHDSGILYNERKIVDCGDSVDEAYLQCCIAFLNHSFGLVATVESFEMRPMLDLRYDAPDMNLEYGISPHISKKIYSFTSEFVDIIQANNTYYGGVLQHQAQAGSTIVPYFSEKHDPEANRIIIQAIDDINYGNIDRDFANAEERYSLLYKKIIKKISELKSIKDLETFQVSIFNEEGERIIKSIDLSQISSIENQLFGDATDATGTVRRPAFRLKSKPNIYSAEVDIEDNVHAIHIDTQNEYFEQLERVLRENEGREVIIEGYKTAEYTILASRISPAI